MLKYTTQSSGRPFILSAVGRAVANYCNDIHRPMGHSIPPRCGKSSIIALTALELSMCGCPMTFVVVPWEFLAAQILDEEKVTKSIAFYAPSIDVDFKMDRVENIKSHLFYKRADKSVRMLALTNGLTHSNVDIFCAAIRKIKEDTGRPPCVMIDEVHLVAMNNDGWGGTIRKIEAAGAFIIGLTGTPISQDKRSLPGFENVVIGETKESQRTQVDLKKIRVTEDGKRFAPSTIITGKAGEYKIVPFGGEEVKWDVAFENRWMAKIDFQLIDVLVNGKDGEPPKKLSEIKESQYGGEFPDWVRSEKIMAPSILNGLERLNVLSAGAMHNQCSTMPRMLVVTSPDRNDGTYKNKGKSNHQAREVKRIIEDILTARPDLTFGGRKPIVEIATSVTDSGEVDKNVLEKIKQFSDGRIDILIVKAMGLVGLDIPELKVLVNLSEFRKGALIYQLVTRICTPWGAPTGTPGERWAFDLCGTYVGPKDVRHIEVQKSIDDVGGTAKFFDAETSTENGDLELKEKDGNEWTLGDVAGASVGTQKADDSLEISSEELALIHVIKRKFPDMIHVSDVAVIRMYRSGAFSSVTPEEVKAQVESMPKVKIQSLAESRDELKGKFGKQAARIVQRYIPYNSQDKVRYVRAVTALQSMAKSKCGIFVSVEEIDDPAILSELLVALVNVTEEFAKKVGRGEL